MKKLPKILLSTLIISVFTPVLNSAKTHALEIDSAGRSWWTISEMLEYKSVIDEEEKNLCAGNIECLTNYRQTKLAEEEKFNALIRLQAYQLMPTELNFKNKTIKILLFDENMRVRDTSREPQTGVVINELAIWLGYNNDPTNNIIGHKIRKIVNNEVPEIYPIFGFTSDNPIELQKDQEIEYPMMTNLENLENYNLSHIRYSTRANYFNGSMITGPVSCLYATNLLNGKCVLYVSARDFRYMFEGEVEKPAEPEQPIEPTEPEEPEEPTKPEEPDAPTEPGQPIQPEEPTEPGQPIQPTEPKTPVETTTTYNVPMNDTNSTPLSPNTGTFTTPCVSKTIEFPWWLIGLIALGDAAVLWLFWPKPKNRQKSTKKLLTKGKKCDKMITV